MDKEKNTDTSETEEQFSAKGETDEQSTDKAETKEQSSDKAETEPGKHHNMNWSRLAQRNLSHKRQMKAMMCGMRDSMHDMLATVNEVEADL